VQLNSGATKLDTINWTEQIGSGEEGSSDTTHHSTSASFMTPIYHIHRRLNSKVTIGKAAVWGIQGGGLHRNKRTAADEEKPRSL
jgi:hypothetical protein